MPTVRKKYQDFPGKNDFCCGGRLIISKSRGIFYLTLGLIVVTSVLFFAFDCRYLAMHVSPLFPIVGGILFLFVLSNLLRTSFIDPGIVPRAKPSEAEFIQRQLDENQTATGQPAARPPRTKDLCINGQTVRVKYCYTCKVFRPPRASHCGICDNCVERFDHHCPWVGNCVGRRNYRYFYLFVLSLSVYCLFVMGSSVAHVVIRGERTDYIDTLKETPTSVAVILIAFFSVWSVVGLAGFHTFLILKEQTTNEDIKGTFSSQPANSGPGARNSVPPNFNPYSRSGCCGNWIYVVCGPLPKSLIDATGEVVDAGNMQNFPLRTAADSSVPSAVVVGGSVASQSTHVVHNTTTPSNNTYSHPKGPSQSSVSQQRYYPTSTNAQVTQLEMKNTHDASLSTICSSSPNSPSKVRPVLLPAMTGNTPEDIHKTSSTIAYSQINHNGDVSPV